LILLLIQIEYLINGSQKTVNPKRNIDISVPFQKLHSLITAPKAESDIEQGLE